MLQFLANKNSRLIQRTLLIPGIATFLITLQTQTVSMTSLWYITDAALVQPESVYYSAETDTIFVSNVVGDELSKDGQGWISQFSPDGQLIESKWVEGLNAPHGIRVHDGQLWVSDIDEVIAIDIQTRLITSRIQIPNAVLLNDIAIAEDGSVFVSDILNNKIYVVQNGQVNVFAEDVELESPNGLLVRGDKLIVASWGKIQDPVTFATEQPGRLFQLDLATGTKTLITETPLGHLDGLEATVAGNLLVSDYNAGKVFLVNPDTGKSHELIFGLSGSADIGFIPEQNLLLVPSMTDHTIAAYQLSF